jgi:NNP family nitrate/nitrite transporter-like MFS transporter
MNDSVRRLSLLSMSSVPLRMLQLAWMVFFVCFFPWLIVAALMPLIRDELHRSNAQFADNLAGMLIFISVASIVGRMRNRHGARRG